MIDPLNQLQPNTLEPARRARGLTRNALAALAGSHSTTISRIERGAVDPRVSETWSPIVNALLGVALVKAAA